MSRVQQNFLFMVLLTSFLVGCKRDEPPVVEEPVIKKSRKTVATTEPLIHFFLRKFLSESDVVETSLPLLKPNQSADIVFATNTETVPWIDASSVETFSALAEDGYGVLLDSERTLQLAEEIAARTIELKLSDEQAVTSVLNQIKDRLSRLNTYPADEFNSFLFWDESFRGWVKEQELPGKYVDLDNDDFTDLGDHLASNRSDYVLLANPPTANLATKLTKHNIESVVLNLALVEGQDPIDCLEGNLSSLSKLLNQYSQTVIPFLEQYCIECHDAEISEGELNFDLYPTISDAQMFPDLWEEAVELLELGDMPPRKSDQPSEHEKEEFFSWVEKLSHKWDSGAMGEDPGQVTLHRLNRNEYNYTMRDLFGIDIRPADKFPEDAGGEAGFNNNADALFLPPLLMENYVESAGLIVEAIYKNRNALQRYLYNQPRNSAEAELVARKVLKFWASRVYRKPVGADELDRLVGTFNRSMQKERNFSKAMRMPLMFILISPNFLFRAESVHPDKDLYKISDFDLANRLSYFLWASMPDLELFRLASQRELSKPKVLEQQVVRMLKDKKSVTLAMHFGGQWFKWEDLRNRVNPDTGKFPTFTFDLRVSMYRESSAFFDNLLKTNGSALDLIDSDYTFVDSRLAQFYGLQGVKGNRLQKVKLNNPNRGGVLGMASVLTATSGSSRTSPSVRGDWILTELMGTPPPEPPMDVDQLPEDDKDLGAQTMRQALEAHSENPNCKSCHQAIDPMGFGLENFDPIGRWRTTNNGLPIDSKGTLMDGRTFDTPAQLKVILLEEKEKFARTMSEKALTYALGRELTPYDRSTVAEIAEKVIADDYRMHRVFLEVARSYPFTHRRKSTYKPTPKP